MKTPEVHGVRNRFVGELPYPLDEFQVAAFDALDAGHSVLVAAPTGSGKTLVAQYAIEQALAKGVRAFYTTPLKALSNQKYHELIELHGSERIGLLTGDVSRQPEAPVVVMTTEVLRNMLYAHPGRLADLGCVVLDEVHFLEDRYRGSVWEEIILSAAREIVLVCLSATVSNAEELASWMAGVRGEVVPVIEEHRPVDLTQLYVVDAGDDGGLSVLPTFVDSMPNPAALELDRQAHRLGQLRQQRPGRSGRPRTSHVGRPRRIDVLERFAADDLLPAIYFIFSRAGCDDALRHCLDAGLRLTSADERRSIRAIADRHVDALSDADLRVLDYGRFRSALESGIASHHAGLVPAFREAVEELFSLALVKVVFATETLALGINMPARSVVIEALSKFSGHGHEDLTPGAFTQLTGRAGRRGIDSRGYAAVLYSPYSSFDDVAALASSRSGPVTSSFRPTPNMTVNLVRRHTRDEAFHLVRSSFAQYQSEEPLTRELDGVLALLARRGYLSGWQLTEAGERLAGLYHDCDLLICEAIEDGIFDGLDIPELAALCSMFTFEARRGQARRPQPTTRLQRRAERLEALADDVRHDERGAGVSQTRSLDSGFAELAHRWARGLPLNQVLHADRRRRGTPNELLMPGGDFVRNIKQLADLLRQIGEVAGRERLERTARRAADALIRDVVALSGLPEEVLEELGEHAGGEVVVSESGAGIIRVPTEPVP